MQKTNHNKSFKMKKLISFNMFRRYLAVFMAILTFIAAIPLSNLMTATAGTRVQRTFHFTFDANGSDSYIEDTWVFNDTDLTQVAEDNDEDACWAAWHIATTWSENDYQQSGDISWSERYGKYTADGYFGDATPYIRIRVIPPEGYHLSDIIDSNNSNMKYIYDGTYIVADVGVLTGSWVDPSGFSHDAYRKDNSLSNITLYWEADAPSEYTLTVSGDAGVKSISGGGTYAAGEIACTRVELNPGYDFVCYIEEDEVRPYQEWYDFNPDDSYADNWGMTYNRNVRAVTKPKKYSIDVNETVYNPNTTTWEQHNSNFTKSKVSLNGGNYADDVWAELDYGTSYNVEAQSIDNHYYVYNITHKSGTIKGNVETLVYMKPKDFQIVYADTGDKSKTPENIESKYITYTTCYDTNNTPTYMGTTPTVNTDELVHTARSSSACFPVFQCTLSAA